MAKAEARAERRSLLLTRPEPQARRFAAQVHQRFGPRISVVISPLMQVRFFAPALSLSGIAALVLSSETGVAAAAALLGRDVPIGCFCVGQRTAEAARAQGWRVDQTAPTAEDLIAALAASGTRGPLLHLHGLHVAGDLAGGLNRAGIETVSAVIYEQQQLPPTAEMTALLAGLAPVIVPLFSPRSALLFQQAAAGAQAPLHIAALSPAVAGALTMRVARCVTAAKPDGENLLDAIASLMPGPR